MRITMLEPDNAVYIDGRCVIVPEMELEASIRCVQFDTERAKGEIEYHEFDDDGDGPKPPVKPPNRFIGTEDFEVFLPVVALALKRIEEEDERLRLAPEPVNSVQVSIDLHSLALKVSVLEARIEALTKSLTQASS